MRAMVGEPVLPTALRRRILLPYAAVRPLVDDPLAPVDGRKKLLGLLQERLHLATRSGAAKPANFNPGDR